MVCEIQLQAAGDWEAFLADHTPPALDDQLKKISYDALTRTFGLLSPAAMFTAIPMTMPMAHLVTLSGKKMEGVAKYPIDAWVAAGNPCFTKEKWALMCILIAERGKEAAGEYGFPFQDKEVFEKLFTTASTMKDSGVYR